MSILEYVNNVKEDVLVVLVICGACVLGFGLGNIGNIGQDRPGAGVQEAAVITSFTPPSLQVTEKAAVVPESAVSAGVVYASRNGKKYYYSHCSGLSRIKPENKISFPTAASAEATGRTLAANCGPK